MGEIEPYSHILLDLLDDQVDFLLQLLVVDDLQGDELHTDHLEDDSWFGVSVETLCDPADLLALCYHQDVVDLVDIKDA